MIGVIADDFTGATDIAGLLARSGADVRLRPGIPETGGADGADAVVIALKCRTAPADEAIASTTAALRWLRARGATRFYWKYCSTFDSTAEGNIGPVAEALMRELDVSWTPYCPAFPENGRTVYMGHLFVGSELLSDSPMRHHPLTPMTDSYLPRVLAPQVAVRTGLIPHPVVATGVCAIADHAAVLVEDGAAHLVVDAIADGDLAAAGAAFVNHPLLTGGSAFASAAYGPALSRLRDPARLPPVPDGPAIILSGSCSAATRGQVARFRATGNRVIETSPEAMAEGSGDLVAEVRAALGSRPVLVSSTADPSRLEAIQAQLGRERAGAMTEAAMANVACAARAAGATRIVVAGGETSGAVALALGATDLRVGPEIAPGVPWCFAEDAHGTYAIALKSGNFGGPGFFTDALDRLPAPEQAK